MARWVLTLLALAGCDRVFDLTGRGPTTDADLDRDGPTGDARTSLCSYPEPANGDADGDAIPNSEDACPTLANGTVESHNEDGDCGGDACDPCPHLPGDDELDTDADGIGDSCDLDTGVNMSRFEGFANVDEIIFDGGPFAPPSNADTLANTSDLLSLAFSNEEARQRGRITTAIDIAGVMTGTWTAGIVFGAEAPKQGSGYVIAFHQGAVGTELALFRVEGTTLVALDGGQTVVLAQTSSLRLDLRIEPMAVKATATIGPTTIEYDFQLPIAISPASTYYGLVTQGEVRAKFRYLWHVQ